MDGEFANKILIVIICMMMLGVGIFVVTMFTTTTQTQSDRIETYAVTNPAVDLVVNVTFNPAAKPTAEQFNGIEWLAVGAADIEWNGFRQVIIENEGMQG